MAYTFEQVFAADPANPANIAQNASITIFAPGDGTMTPIAITDPDGQPLANPIPVNANGFGSAFAHATLDRVAWAGGGFTGFFTSYEGMKNEAVAARAAAESAAATAGTEAAAVADAAIGIATNDATAAAASAATAATNASASATAAANAAALVGAPADTAIAAAVNGTGATKTALNAAYGSKARVYHDFTGDIDGALTSLDSGQPWHLATTPGNDSARLRVVSGFMTNIANTGGATSAGHAMVTTINEPFNRIGADIAFDAGTTSGGVAGLIIWSEPLIYPGPVVDSAIHLTFSTLGWDLTTFTGGVGTSVSSGTFLTPLVEDGATLYRVEAVIPGDGTVLVTLPDGRIVTVAVAALATKARIVPAWETFQSDASTDRKAKFKRVWADTAFGSPTEKFASVPQVTQTVKTVVQASRGVAVQYPAVGAGNVALTIPTTATEINTALRASFVAPQSGKVMVTLNGQINQTAAGDIQWTLLIPEGGQSHLRLASKLVQEQVLTLTILVTGLTPGNLYSTRWQHRATGASAGVLRLNADGGQLATLSVQPVN